MANKNDWQKRDLGAGVLVVFGLRQTLRTVLRVVFIRRDYQDGGPIMKKLAILGIIGGAAILTAAPLSLQWSQKDVGYRLPALKPKNGRQLRRALQVSAEGHIAAHTAARLTLLVTALDCTPAMDARRLPATGYLTEQAGLHLMASPPAATPKLANV